MIMLNKGKYFIVRSYKFILCKRNGFDSIALMESDNQNELKGILDKIYNDEFETEQDLFNHIYELHKDCSIFNVLK